MTQKRKHINWTAEETFRRNYEATADTPVAWRMTADSLLRAANLLLKTIEEDFQIAESSQVGDSVAPFIQQIYMMLAGFAIENLAKAKIIETSARPTISNDKLSAALKSHKLLELLEQAGLDLTEEQGELAERLQAFAEWAGRYPIAVRLKDQMPREYAARGWGPLSYFQSSDPAAIGVLVEKISG